VSSSTADDNRQRDLLDGRYRLTELLGRGGTASVWRGEDERLGRSVAVKILDADDSDRHREEAQTLARLSHPHIASVYDVGESEGRPYLVIELAEGRSLAALLSEYELAWPAAVACCAQVASALAAAHARGLVHRDVKPSNIMLTPAGVKLVDFGISTSDGGRETDADGHVRGTPAYSAPERLTGDTVAPAADVYSLGVVLFRSLAGRLPDQPVTAGQPRTGQRIVSALPDDVPAEVVDACLRSLDVDPARRPIAEHLAALLGAAVPPGVDLAALAAVSPTAPSRAVDPGPTRPMPAAQGFRLAAVVVGLLLLVMLAWSATGWGLVGTPVTTHAAAPVPPAEVAGCAVTYHVQSDDGRRFVAAITAKPGDMRPDAGWRLSVQLPEGSVARPSGGWQADGALLTSPAQPALGDGKSARLTLAGRRTASDGALALPTEIHLDGRECDVSADGAITSPVRAAEPEALAKVRSPDHARPAAKGHGNGGHEDQPGDSGGSNGRGRSGDRGA
jgi:eukaryotic-like serine/threonine-protein kinase